MSQNFNDKKRLLEALEYIDEGLVSDTLSRVRPEAIAPKGNSAPKKHFSGVRQIALIAACALLLGAAIPMVNYVLPMLGVAIGGNAGAGGSSDPAVEENLEEVTYSEHMADMSDRDLIEHVGEVPEEFVDIINENLFDSIWVSGEKIIKKASSPYDIEVYDLYGNILHRIDIKGDAPEYFSHMHKIHSLSDGTYLFVIPYDRSYKGETTDARAICFDENGDILFNTKLDVSAPYFDYFFETDDAYILADGSYQRRGMYFVKLDKSGKVLKTLTMGGEESDRLYAVNYVDGKLMAYMREHRLSASRSTTLTVTFDNDLNIVKYNQTDSFPTSKFQQHSSTKKWDVRAFVLGYNPGKLGDEIPATGGYVTGVIEYDDFVLIISERDTKWFEYVPMIYSTIPAYTETVYTAHALDGTILWRTAVDSTDYARLAAIRQEYNEEQERFEKWRKEQTDID